MATLKSAHLALSVVTNESGIRTIESRIPNMTEFMTPVPSTFKVALPFWFEDEPGAVFSVATEVRTDRGKVLWFDSGKLGTPESGRGEFSFDVPVPVLAVGPVIVALLFDGRRVWEQTVFFALS